MKLLECNPHIRYVNNYSPAYTFVEKERVIYDFEFIYIMAGKVIMNYAGQQYHLKQGDLFYLSPGVKNHIEVLAEWKLQTHCIHFDWISPEEKYDFTAEEFYMHSVLSDNHIEKELLLKRRPIDKPDDFVIPVCSTNLPREIFAPLFERCYREYCVGSQVARVHMKSLFWEIIFRLIQIAGEDGDHKEAAHPHILRAIRYIKENYNKHLTVAELATKYELSPKYFGKLFHQTTGKSVNAFILDLRIFAAKEMLMGTDLSLDEIAAEIGFCDAFYFSNCFKKAEGIAPSNYRIVMQKK